MPEAAVSAPPADGTELLSTPARARIAPLAALADCKILVGSTTFPNLHRVTLSMESTVLRSLIKDIASCSTITLHDNSPAEIALMISLMYERHSESLKADNVDKILKLCSKYDLKCIHATVERFVLTMKLDGTNIVRWLEVARDNREELFVDRCMQFLAGPTVLRTVLELEGEEWLKAMDEATQLRLALPALRTAYGKADPKKSISEAAAIWV